MATAAGILFLTKDQPRKALFLQRGDGGDCPLMWCFPGGHAEEGETPAQAAVRETKEECGEIPDGDRVVLTRSFCRVEALCGEPQPAADPAAAAPAGVAPSLAGAVDFTTFIQMVDAEFSPKINGEHLAWTWAPITSPPQPLHPGCEIVLFRLQTDELGVARAIADGRLTSPQRYENVTLFALRITGTGLAYRRALEEHVWRDPSIYLNDEFLARCNGLPVIFEHPKKALLDSKEFADRVVGTIVLPYIVGDEVWGIAKIYDDAAASLMEERQLSTSPAVTWRDLSVNTVVRTEDGSKLLLEGKPSLLDHVAICEQGVWDKEGEPEGVRVDAERPSLMKLNLALMKARNIRLASVIGR